MGKPTKLKKIFEDMVDINAGVKGRPEIFEGVKTLRLKDYKTNENNKASFLKKEAIVQEEKMKNEKHLSAEEKVGEKKEKAISPIKQFFQKEKKTKTSYQKEDMLKMVEARKIQIMTKSGLDPASSSPLQMHLVRSESLRIAQDKIIDLEEELHEFRQNNESLVSASEVLKDKNDQLQSKLEDLKYLLKEEKGNFKDEKEVLLSTLEEAKTQLIQLRGKKQELEKRLSNDLHGIRTRESSLESRIEIMKMENSVLQREKDKKIIELKKQMQKIKSNLDGAHKKNQDLQTLNNKLQESSRRTVSALRATIYNLEGVRSKEETIVTEIRENK